MCCKVSAAEYEVGIIGLFMNRCELGISVILFMKNLVII